MMKYLRRLTALLCCLLLSASTALSEGLRFHLQADVESSAYPAGLQQLMEGVALLLDSAELEGELVMSGAAFALDASLLIGSSRTDLRVYGLDSHWGVRSSLLGDEELMVNCAALLPFGEKAREHLGLPLDAAALLAPYTHTAALASAKKLLSPLFPEENGKTRLSRHELDELVAGLMRLCDEDPALNRYLEVTGLYRTAKRYCEAYFEIPELMLSSLTIKRTDTQLTWSSGLLTLMNLEQQADRISLHFSIPTAATVSFSAQNDGQQLSGSVDVSLSSVSAKGSFTLPARLTSTGGTINLTLDAESPVLPEGGVSLRVEGSTSGNSVTLRQLDPVTGAALLTITGTLIPCSTEEPPAYTPDDLTGVDILSVNSDSLHALLREVKWPLLEGVLSIVAEAPAEAVQTLMDYAEDSGLLDMLTDAMSGGSGY